MSVGGLWPTQDPLKLKVLEKNPKVFLYVIFVCFIYSTGMMFLF